MTSRSLFEITKFLGRILGASRLAGTPYRQPTPPYAGIRQHKKWKDVTHDGKNEVFHVERLKTISGVAITVIRRPPEGKSCGLVSFDLFGVFDAPKEYQEVGKKF